MIRLRYCTVETLEDLRRTVPDRLDWYYAPGNTYPPSSLGGFREAKIEAPQLASKLEISSERPPDTDASNAILVYDALRDLTPHQASIERLWVYICHFDCPTYISARWLKRRVDDEDLAAREIRNHFLRRATGDSFVITEFRAYGG